MISPANHPPQPTHPPTSFAPKAQSSQVKRMPSETQSKLVLSGVLGCLRF